MSARGILPWMLACAMLTPAAGLADEACPTSAPSLRFLGLNEQGAEEWWRAKDDAIVIRVPGGPYAKRPYEGWVAIEEPVTVTVPTFFLDKHEVTNAQFAAFLNSREDVRGLVVEGVPGLQRRIGPAPAWRSTPGLARHPVTAATGRGALEYARWVGGCLPDSDQWEKAAGGPGGRTYPWGEEPPNARLVNFATPRPRGLLPVGSFVAGASPYGALDMAGNAYERVRAEVRDGVVLPVLLKGGSWVSPHPLNLRVLDMCMQPMGAAEASVGFRCAMHDPEPDRPARRPADAPPLRLAADFDEAVAEARRRRVPLFLSLQYDSCGQCDRTRLECFRDPRFVAYCNEHAVVVVGHQPGDAFEAPHQPLEEDACPLYPGVTCEAHEVLFARGLRVVGAFTISPGNFVLHPDRIGPGAGAKAVLLGEESFPTWGNAVDAYLAALEQARRMIAAEDRSAGR